MILNKFRYLLFLFIGWGAITSSLMAQQILEDKTISISVYKEKFSNVLDLVQKKTNIDFCYQSDIIPDNMIVTVTTTDAPLINFLNALFASVYLDYKIINGQVAIYKPDTQPPEGEKSVKEIDLDKGTAHKPGKQAAKKADKKQNIPGTGVRMVVYDTIVTLIYDTLNINHFDTILTYLYDTINIRNYDTLLYYDTVAVNQPVMKMSNASYESFKLYGGSILTSGYNFSPVSNEYQHLADSMQQNLSPIHSYQFGININFSYRNWFAETGMSYTFLREELNYTELAVLKVDTFINWEYFYRRVEFRDTVDIYYELPDSILHYTVKVTIKDIYDSALIVKLDSTTAEYDKTSKNSFTYFEFPFIIGSTIYTNNNLSISAYGGIITGFLIRSNADRISVDNSHNTTISNNILSIIGGLGVEYKFTNYIGVFMDAYYRKSYTNISTPGYTISKAMNQFGVKCGLTYRF